MAAQRRADREMAIVSNFNYFANQSTHSLVIYHRTHLIGLHWRGDTDATRNGIWGHLYFTRGWPAHPHLLLIWTARERLDPIGPPVRYCRSTCDATYFGFIVLNKIRRVWKNTHHPTSLCGSLRICYFEALRCMFTAPTCWRMTRRRIGGDARAPDCTFAIWGGQRKFSAVGGHVI